MPVESLAEVDSLIAAQRGHPFMDSRLLFLPAEIAPFHFTKGKVRQNYDLGDSLIMVCSDALSAFDVVMNEGVPGKGIILTQLSNFWTTDLLTGIPNHLISANVDDFPTPFRGVDELRGRAIHTYKAKMVLIECVARGYLSGSGWAEYRKTCKVTGINLPEGLVESDKLPEPIFTPATKADTGHDENITLEQMGELIGTDLAEELKNISLRIYTQAANYALERGIILADTKFEFGFLDDRIILADEVLTPDSSRFWPVDQYRPGGLQPSFDKQFVRDYLDSTGWNHEPPPPPLPQEVIDMTAEKYREAYRRLVAA